MIPTAGCPAAIPRKIGTDIPIPARRPASIAGAVRVKRNSLLRSRPAQRNASIFYSGSCRSLLHRVEEFFQAVFDNLTGEDDRPTLWPGPPGSNTAESHPVLATRIKRAHKLRGQKLIVADLRKHEMARSADIHLQPRTGSDLVWLSAITRYLLDEGLAKKEFIDRWVNGFDEYKKSLEQFTMEFAEQVTGIPAETLKKVAHMIAEADGVCVC